MGKNHRLVIARKARNMNRPDLAGELRRLSAERKRPRGTAPSGVLRWEDGRKPELETQKLLAELFDIDPHLVGTPPLARLDRTAVLPTGPGTLRVH